MSEEQGNEQMLWERAENEPSLWYARFSLFRKMGYARTFLGAYHLEQDEKGQKRTDNLPTSWREAIKQWEWRKRAEAWDEEQERLALAASKYTRVSERVKLLDTWVSTQDAIMVASVADKGYARADSMEQLRGLLDDIAKETGGRVKVSKKDIAITSLPKEYHGFDPDTDGVDV